MAIFITGDMHGSSGVRRFDARHFDDAGLTRDDCVIVLGDFGLVWHDPPSAEERYWLDWLEAKPWTTLFIDGNHENHDLLGSYPAEDWHGGSVHFIREHVIHLMRGQVIQIGGHAFFSFGGAHSTDRESRMEGLTWWPGEVPSREERDVAVRALDEAGWRVDFVLTHCPPLEGYRELVPRDMRMWMPHDELNQWLQEEIADKLEYRHWFYGHMHEDRYGGVGAAPFEKRIALFGDMLRIGDDGELSLARKNDCRRLPPPRSSIGYSASEIATIASVSEGEAKAAMSIALFGQTVGIHPETGERLVYECDAWQVFQLLEREWGERYYREGDRVTFRDRGNTGSKLAGTVLAGDLSLPEYGKGWVYDLEGDGGKLHRRVVCRDILGFVD